MKPWVQLVVLLGVVALASVAVAQEGSVPPATSTVPSLGLEAPTRPYLDRLSPEERQRSDAYFEGGYRLHSLAEIEAVTAHETGHHALNHIYESISFLGIVLVLAFLFVRATFDGAVARRGQSWGVRDISDVAGLPLLSALFSLYFFLGTPFLSTYIRVNEAEADLFGLHTARRPEGFAEVALKLGEYRKLDPGPLEEWIFFDHPSGRARIETAMKWRAEQLEDIP